MNYHLIKDAFHGTGKVKIVKFVDNGFELEVNVSPSEDTVWLKVDEMAMLC